MSHPVNHNFMPGIRCPYCDTYQHAEISGWGRIGLNVRSKCCKNCEREFNVVIYVGAAGEEDISSDGYLRMVKDTIKRLEARRERETTKLEHTEEMAALRLAGRDN